MNSALTEPSSFKTPGLPIGIIEPYVRYLAISANNSLLLSISSARCNLLPCKLCVNSIVNCCSQSSTSKPLLK